MRGLTMGPHVYIKLQPYYVNINVKVKNKVIKINIPINCISQGKLFIILISVS